MTGHKPTKVKPSYQCHARQDESILIVSDCFCLGFFVGPEKLPIKKTHIYIYIYLFICIRIYIYT